MKISFRAGSNALLAASFGLVVALFAGGCAGEADDVSTGGAEAEQGLSAGHEESGDAISVGDEADDVHVTGHPAGCRCGICTGGRLQAQ